MRYSGRDFSDPYPLVGLQGAIVAQAIIDAYKGRKKQREEALNFFGSKEYRDVIVNGFKDFRIKFAVFFQGCEGSFDSIADIIRRGGAERLYRACRVARIVEGGRKPLPV